MIYPKFILEITGGYKVEPFWHGYCSNKHIYNLEQSPICFVFRQYQKSKEKPFKQEELDQLLAPVALYPDSLVAKILMASTYPLEVVQAERWVKQNENLTGDALTAALEQQSWDPSVKSLVKFGKLPVMFSGSYESDFQDDYVALEWTINFTVKFLFPI